MPYLSTTPTTLTTPPPEYIPPPEAQAPPAEPAPAPQQAAPPPEQAPQPQPQQAAPAGDVLSGPARQSSAPSQEQQLTQVFAESEPAPSTGSPTDAIGATAAQIPGAILSGPGKGKELVQAAPGATGKFVGATDTNRQYQPAPTDTPGLGTAQAALSAQEAEAGFRAAQEASRQDPGLGTALNELGAFKDSALAKLGLNRGQVIPEMAGNQDALMDYNYQILKTGAAPEETKEPLLVGPNGTPLPLSRDALYQQALPTRTIQEMSPEDRANFVRAYEEGFVSKDQNVYAPGPQAAWEFMAEGMSGIATGLADLETAPATTIGNVVADVLTAKGASVVRRSGELAARGIGAQTGKSAIGGTAMEVAGRGINAGLTFGLSEAVPAGFTALGKGYRALPWLGKPTARALQDEAATAAEETVGAVLANRRMAEGQPGVPGLPPVSHVSQPTPDPQVFRVALPGDGLNPPIDITYHTKNGVVNGVYDTVLPTPGAPYRRPTVADAQAAYDLWARLPPADRHQVRDAFFPTLSKYVETAPGEPFIENAAEHVFDRQGNLIADTGRAGEGHARWVEDLRRTIIADGRPEQIITDFSRDWQRTLGDGMTHPLTRRFLAEHRLQGLKNVLAQLPASYRTPAIQRHVREMEAMLPREAPAIGTGLKWRGPLTPAAGGQGPQGGLIPASAREQSWLTEMAALSTPAFRDKGLAGGRVGGATNIHLVFDRKPEPQASPAYHNGYTTYLDLMDFRLKNPPLARSEITALKEEVNGLRTADPTKAAQAREDAIKDALERSGAIPGASLMDADALVIAIEQHLRATRPTFPSLPGAAPTPPAGIYPAGSQSELWGMDLGNTKWEADLSTQVEIGGTAHTVGHLGMRHFQETALAQEAATRQGRGVDLNASDARLLNTQVAKIAGRFPEHKGLTAAKLAAMRPEEIDRLSAALLKADIQTSQGLRSASGKMLTPAEQQGLVGRVLEAHDQFVAKWRSAVLYNLGRGVQYPMLQLTGNLVGLGIVASSVAKAGGSPLRMIAAYLNPKEYARAFRLARNPETAVVPTIIDHLDRVGDGRSHNLLGRITKDQLGARTGFNQERSHPITKALGVVLGNQRIKDAADTFDIRNRQSIFAGMWEPAYARLKMDLAPMAEERFSRFAQAAGVPVGITRTQIDTALKHLEKETGGYFSQPQLRQALFDAGGGNSAPNRDVLLKAADRLARDYTEQRRLIGEVAHAEVNRIAFSGGDTNLEASLQRGFMFTWWITRASRLYLTEAAKSPLQLLAWGRAMEEANQQERGGTSAQWKFFTEFMATPAGYTGSMNLMSVFGTYLLGNASDPADERSVLTAYGQLLNGEVGDNLILSPMLRAIPFALGAEGRDARTPDLFGSNRLERELVDGLNWANQNLIAFSQTKGGNPQRIPYPGISGGVINRLAQVLAGQLPGTQPVGGYDPNTAPEAALESYVGTLVQRANPELDPTDAEDADLLRHGIDVAMDDHDSPLYQEAQRLWVDSLYQGPLTDKDTAALDVLGAVLRRWVLPVSTSIQPTDLVELRERRGRDALRKEGVPYLGTTPESSQLDVQRGTSRARSPEGRDLALVRDAALGDPTTQKVKTLADGLKWNDAADLQATFAEVGITQLDLDVNGQRYSFSAEQIALLPEEDRSAIMNYWLDASGMRPVMDAYYENKQAQLQADKAFADAEGWATYAKQYPGGIDRAVDDTAQINPNFKRFIEGDIIKSGKRVHLPDLRVTDHAAWQAEVTQWDQVASVIAGVKDSRYGLDIDPKYAGVVAGLTEPVGAWLLRENETRKTGADSEYGQEITANLDKFAEVGKSLDTLDAKYGQPVGTYRAIMAQNILAGALDYADDKSYALPKGVHDELKAMGVSDYFENTTALKNYLGWQLAQPAGVDTSVDAYQTAYWAEKNAKAIPEIALRLATGQVPALSGEGATAPPYDPTAGLVLQDGAVGLGVRPGLATLAGPTILASEPGGAQGVSAPAGMPVRTGQMMTGSDGSTWVHVQTGDGLGGWMNLANLTPAA